MTTHEVNEKTNERIIVSENDFIEVCLKENPTTGFQWIIQEMDSATVQLLKEDYQNFANVGIGGGGEKIFRFKVLKELKGHIKFVNKQEWSGDVSETFVLNYA